MSVFVVDRSGKPLVPCCEKRACKLLATTQGALPCEPLAASTFRPAVM